MSQRLADFLVQEGMIPSSLAGQTRDSNGGHWDSPVAELIRSGQIDDEKLARWLSNRFKLPLVNISRVKIDDRAREHIPQGILEAIPCIPLGTDGAVLVVAIADPTVLPELEAARGAIQPKIEVVLTTYTAFWEAYRAQIVDASFWDAFQEEVGDESTLINVGGRSGGG